jgi:hypothetical protein
LLWLKCALDVSSTKCIAVVSVLPYSYCRWNFQTWCLMTSSADCWHFLLHSVRNFLQNIFPIILTVVITEFHSCAHGVPLLFLKYTLQVTFYKGRNLIPKAQSFERNGLGNSWTAKDNIMRLKCKEPVSVMVDYMTNYPLNVFGMKVFDKN